jgi:hypothetical protein
MERQQRHTTPEIRELAKIMLARGEDFSPEADALLSNDNSLALCSYPEGAWIVETHDDIDLKNWTKLEFVVAGSDRPEKSMFRVTCLGERHELIGLAELCAVINALRDVEVEVQDLRKGGKSHRLTIGPTGFVHETFGASLVVNDVRLLLESPGRPVYA